MKPAFAITLIIIGAFLIALPPISDYFWRADTIRLFQQQPGVSNVHLEGQMGDEYRISCFVVGTIVIGIACFYSVRRPHA
ncbi:MAG: hypothetical protein JW829_17550 [Pirellulales bacterium]|nr:hypothetical protein [Pirellulales bacterium]